MICKCNPFDIDSIRNAFGGVIQKLRPDDEVVINYAGGTHTMSLVMGAVAVLLSRVTPIRIVYSTRTPDGKESLLDHTEPLGDFFGTLGEVLGGSKEFREMFDELSKLVDRYKPFVAKKP